MWLILLSYLLMASTFTLAKTAVFYMQPIYFIAFRMIIAGTLLLGYIRFFNRSLWRYSRTDLKLLSLIVIFHIYCAYIFEFWALQYITSGKACLLYNLSPFITALLCYFMLKQKLTYQKWLALILGFAGMVPVLMSNSGQEDVLAGVGLISLADLAMVFAIGSSAYGWIVMKELIGKHGYSPIMVNGWGMLFGGVLALLTAVTSEGTTVFITNTVPHDLLGTGVYSYFGAATPIVAGLLCMLALIVIANIIGYNLYGYLLRRYSPTFLSFAGFITPFFASIFGWIFLNEALTGQFFLSLAITIFSLYLFYQEELQ